MNVMKESPAVNSVIKGLAYQDRDMNIMYTKGPNTTVMFYLSTKISLSSSSYVAVHRTFPGIVKNSTTYNPPTRPWFKNASQDSYNVHGPYVETFTRQRVVTLSTLSTATDAATNQTLSTVAAGVMLIDTLSSIGIENDSSKASSVTIKHYLLMFSEQSTIHQWRIRRTVRQDYTKRFGLEG